MMYLAVDEFITPTTDSDINHESYLRNMKSTDSDWLMTCM